MTAPLMHAFFLELRAQKAPVSLKEYLALLEGLDRGAAPRAIEDFYYFSRAVLIKDERHLDIFDRVFASVFKGLEALSDGPDASAFDIPEEWLRRLAEKHLTDEEKALIESLGGFEQLMETLKKRLEEQKERHQGGSKWIGTAGTSPFGAYGYNPEGVRIGQHESRHRRAVKVWDKREFKNFSDDRLIGARNIQMALRKLRRFAREGAQEELDLDGTIRGTAQKGYLDVRMRPERHNAVKVLLLLDVGGSMDPHVRTVEELFSAAKAEFKRIDHWYFHNCLYEFVWKENARRWNERHATWDMLNTYPPDTKVIVVGDASMSPYEIAAPGGAVEHWNDEPGAAWLQRLMDRFPALAWMNPEPETYWTRTQSITMIRQIIGDRMFPLTVDGVGRAAEALKR